MEALAISDKIDVVAHALRALTAAQSEVIVRGIHLPRWRESRYKRLNVDVYGFKNLAERLNERLRTMNDHALIIADDTKRSSAQRFELEYGRRIGTTGYRTQTLDRIVDTVHFVDSHLSPMVQLADLVTYVKRRAAAPRHKDERAAQAHDRLLEIVDTAIPGSAYNQIYWAPSPSRPLR